MGGSWEDQPYQMLQAVARSPWDRSLANGFRCALYPEDSPPDDTYFEALNQLDINFRAVKPISDEVFTTLRNQGDYGDIPLEASLESQDSSSRNWNTEMVTITNADGSRLLLEIILPKNHSESSPALIFFPGIDSVLPGEFNRELYLALFDFIPKSGRALIVPHYRNQWENSDGTAMQRMSSPSGGPVIIREWSQDFGRTLKYLATRNDLRDDPGFVGMSLGAIMGNYLVSFHNDSLSVAVLTSGGFSAPTQPQYVPRITIPTIMVNGDADYIFPVESTQLPMFDMIGTDPEHKKHVILDGGHMPEKSPFAREILAWLDIYQPIIRDTTPHKLISNPTHHHHCGSGY